MVITVYQVKNGLKVIKKELKLNYLANFFNNWFLTNVMGFFNLSNISFGHT